MRLIEAHVTMTGTRPLLFDRYAGNDAKLDPVDKCYWAGGVAVIPQANLYSGLSAENTKSVVKIYGDIRKAKAKGMAINQALMIRQFDIPILRDGVQITRDDFDDVFQIVQHVARVAKGIPNPKTRPMLPLPWSIEYDIEFMETPELTWTEMRGMLLKLGSLGLGTFRPLYGGSTVLIEERDARVCEEFAVEEFEEV